MICWIPNLKKQLIPLLLTFTLIGCQPSGGDENQFSEKEESSPSSIRGVVVNQQANAERTTLLTINSLPSSSDIFVDGVAAGKTPLRNQSVRTGTRLITLRLDGHIPIQFSVVLYPDIPADLGTQYLAPKGASLNTWLVGSPHDGKTPESIVPDSIQEKALPLDFKLEVHSFSAADFPSALMETLSKEGHADPPDLIVGSNYLPFEEVLKEPNVANALMPGGKRLYERGFVFLVEGSPNYAGARMMALGLDVAGNGDNSIQNTALAATEAYIAGRGELLKAMRDEQSLDHSTMLDGRGPRPETVIVMNPKIEEVLGNSKLAFVLSTASFEARIPPGAGPFTKMVSSERILSVFRNTGDGWRLITITNDPISLGGVRQLRSQLSGFSGGEDVRLPTSASIIGPADGAFPRPATGQRFGNFEWRPSASSGVMMSVVEFNYGRASRLVFAARPPASAGDLWTTGGEWRWRIWTISTGGEVVFSDSRRFTH